jgi:hypothetical protein
MRKMLTLVILAGLNLATVDARAVIIQYEAVLSGVNEVPANASPATGVVNIVFNTAVNTFNLTGSYAGLVGPVTAAHVHGPAPVGVNAGILFPIATTIGVTSGTLTANLVLTPAQASHLLSGLTYVNVHSTMFPGGEIRGQIVQVPAPGALAFLGLAGLMTARRRTPAES